VENRAVSVLAFNVGMCEDYAAAFTLLLRGMGLEAEYVPGLTYAADGTGFVDHSWAVCKIDGVWYHLDCQLEQNITRRGRINYRYFMRGDATLAGSHRWGQNLIDSRLLTDAQNKEIAESFIAPACPQDYPTPPPHEFTPPPKPDLPALKAKVEAEIKAANLPPLELNITPPVFGAAGYPISS
jgi:transglutaminase-like putative cysteine protease